ncbi:MULTISPECIES: FAD-dependent oxidoreductase [Actinomycetes]|jgi:NADPH-dependent 2,4-dienoyl-CoA reductase/sulfur reductase-like enzyme|uniref:FAD-dependent oxidoreductase n=1 Tax=Bifidobacterium crudilactis TaxID=327277 RepID=A0A971CZR0_9BIFI|nr:MULTISPECIES: FAD-dependent oxidoreductase [Actinomycetes]MDN5972576.1 FAD-dependent oxidoreductase [Bifidobacterium crudilactis]MDN5997554.1 FAD-dependent oxidoreductase [Acidipropionibacterium jensenii]MDN6468035.1 FAD-dependent oxidoreductase [Bifidobacterium crudilactis]MDN6593452.1 FAD-dependent oxidoreductase [Acidipropionibacterium jensenii]MDN6659709.1 FAD-dependent oxidoreductase [Acidipropionibacterium jensenii]
MRLLIIGGSDAGIMAGLRARQLEPQTDVTLVVADQYPNYSICGIPYHLSGDVPDWHDLAHRTQTDLEAAGLSLRLGTLATSINADAHTVTVTKPDGNQETISYDRLVVATGARPTATGITGLTGPDALGPADCVHQLHTIDQMHAVQRTLVTRHPRRAVIIGAGYIGLEMAEALTRRGLDVTMLQHGPEVLSTLDTDLASLVHSELVHHGVHLHLNTSVRSIQRGERGPVVISDDPTGTQKISTDLVIAVTGIRPNTSLLTMAGATTGPGAAIEVDDQMRTSLPDIYAAGDGVTTKHRLLGDTWLPLGTTAHKQGRIAGENAVGGNATFAGVLGTQAVKVFSLVAARTGLRETEAHNADIPARSITYTTDDHKAYYPGSHPITIRLTGNPTTGQLLGAQIVGTYGTEIAKRSDILTTAIFTGLTIPQLSDLDLAYTPPLAAPWDAIQATAQQWQQHLIWTGFCS